MEPINKAPSAWSCTKQTVAPHSIAEAEYMTTSTTARENHLAATNPVRAD